jgi:sporulation protein YlmC with PRC-barrel domain
MNKKILIPIFVIILAYVVIAIPLIEFTNPTPANATTQSANYIELNISIIEQSLDELIYNWNGTNYTIYNDSLILMMNFDNLSSLGESNSLIVDMSKHSHNGTNSGAKVNDSGIFGKAFEFDGSSLINLSNSKGLDINEQTITAWLKTDIVNSNWHFAYGAGSDNWGIDYGISQGNKWATEFMNSSGSTDLLEGTAPTTGQWMHLSFTYDGSNIYLYENGAQVDSGSITGDMYASDIYYIGSKYDGGFKWDGTIDELRIWNRSLSADEIYQVYASNLNRLNQTQWYLYVNQSKNATTALSDGNYTHLTYAKNSLGNTNQTEIRTITISTADTISPLINITLPINNSNQTINKVNINFTVSDTNLQTCWYSNDTMLGNITITCGDNITSITWTEGQHNVTVWANDSSGNENSSSITFNINTTSAPIVTLDLDWLTPVNGFNVSQYEYFNVSVNITCRGGNCGAVNVSLDPQSGDTNYTVTDFDGHYNESECASNHNTGNDDTVRTISDGLGFDFPYFNITKNNGTTIYMDTNGRLSWSDTTTDLSPTENEMKSEENIAANWQDLGAGSVNNEYWCLNQGTAPNRYAVFRWNSQWYSSAGAAQMEIVLRENGDIEINYGNIANHTDTWIRGISKGNSADYYYNTSGSVTDALSNKGWKYSLSSTSDKGGLISTNLSATPFNTNVTNPYNLTLNEDESTIITWWINATGDYDESYIFFVYANQTSNETVGNITSNFNITIRDLTPPSINITYPLNITHTSDITIINYTYSDSNADSCWYSTDSGVTNSTPETAGTNFSSLTSAIGSNTWILFCNDTSNNLNTSSVTFNLNITPDPIVTLDLDWLTPVNGFNVSQYEYFNVSVNITCRGGNCGAVNVSLDPSAQPVSCKEILDLGLSTGDGIYTIYPHSNATSYDVYCDMTTDSGGWTLVGSVYQNTMDDLAVAYHSNLTTLTPTDSSTSAQGIWGGMRDISNTSYAHTNSTDDIRFSCKNDVTNSSLTVDLAFYSIHWYYEITNSTSDASNCFEEANGAGDTQPTPRRKNLINGTEQPYGNNWNANGYLEGEDSCGDTGDFTVDFDDRGMDGNQNDGTDWGEDDSSKKCGSGTASTGAWFVWFKEAANYSGGKGGLISTNLSATPFNTNVTNPYNLTLNEDESTIITWWINATGDYDESYIFFVYANQTSNETVGNITSNFNITIRDLTPPSINITYPLNITHTSDITIINYTYSDSNADSCWYSTDSGVTNSTPETAGTNFSSLTSSIGSNTWILFCNDTSNNLNTTNINFAKILPVIGLQLISPVGNINVSSNETFEVSVNVSCSVEDCGVINVTLDPASNSQYNFTSCSASGINGPSQANCDANYSGTSLDGLVNVSAGIQNWSIPESGTYTIKACGASGVKGGSSGGEGGAGACIIGDFILNAGDIIKVAVGQNGSRDGTYAGGGGGGTFVIDDTNSDILIIAGGGGGGSIRSATFLHGRNATTNETGTYGSIDATLDFNAPSNNGSGGLTSTNGGGAGGGYNGDGADYVTSAIGGHSYENGLTGGDGTGSSVGGFGGGGSGYGGGGGGGGYNGAGGGGYTSNGGGGGGGGSINNGTNQNNTSPFNYGDGYVIFTLTGSTKGGTVSTNLSATPFNTNVTNPYNISLNKDESAIITWTINATGDTWNNYTFFVYANKTSDESTGNITTTWNVTIVNFTVDNSNPQLSIVFPQNNNFYSRTNLEINYTVSDTNLQSCWYSNDTLSSNISLTCGSNITIINWTDGQHNVTIWANDTFSNQGSSSVSFTIDSVNPIVTLSHPLNNSGTSQNVTLNYTISDTNNITNCSLIFNQIINQTNSTINKSLIQGFELKNLAVGHYNWSVNCTDEINNQGSSEIRRFGVIKKTIFSGSTTDFTNVNIGNIINLIIDNTEYGTFNFTEVIDLTNGADIDSYINISFNRLELNSTALPELNKSAKLKLYNLTFDDPQILKNGEICSTSICSEESYSSGTLTFNVSSFTVYSTRETPAIISDDAESGGGGGSGGGSSTTAPEEKPECIADNECNEGYTCFNDKCVKLFDVEILSLQPDVQSLSFQLKYLIKGVAEIDGDVIIKFRIENSKEVLELGQDTIYLGKFEEKIKITNLNLPTNIQNGIYDLYVQVIFENYKAESFRKLSINLPEDIILDIEGPQLSPKENLTISLLWWVFILVGFMIFLIIKALKGDSKVLTNLDINEKQYSLKSQKGKKVFSNYGNVIGKIDQPIITNNKIEGWIIIPNKEFKFKKKFLIKHKDVIAIKDIFIVNEHIEKYFKRHGVQVGKKHKRKFYSTPIFIKKLKGKIAK